MKFPILLGALVFTSFLSAQSTAPNRYLSPLDCIDRGRVGSLNVVENGGLKFKVSQKGHDAYNAFSISKTTEVSGVKTGSFIFKSLPNQGEVGNGAYSKKLHFDIYDYGNLNGNKDKELIKAGDTIHVSFLVKFVTDAPAPTPGSKFDNGSIRYLRNLFFQFWPGGVATHFSNYPRESEEAKAGKFGYVTVMTAEYGENKVTISPGYEVKKDTWYRMYFHYNPDVSDGRISARIARHRNGLLTEEMTTIFDLKGNTIYEDRSHRRILPTFGSYHWGECPSPVETHFTEVYASREHLKAHPLRQGRQ